MRNDPKIEQHPAQPQSPANMPGRVDQLTGSKIVGWVRSRHDAGRPPTVQLWVEHEMVASARADLRDGGDLQATGLSDGRAGFSLEIPARLRDGQKRRATVRLAENGQTLAEGEFEFGLSDLEGSLDACTDAAAQGWARSVFNPDETLALELWVDGQRCSVGYADLYRADLEAGGIGHGRYGYSLPLPDAAVDGAAHVIEVKSSSRGTALAGSPMTFKAENRQSAATGTLDEVTPAGAVGWAAPANRGGTAIDVELVVDGRALARARADLHRSDLAAAGYGSRHAFRIALPEQVFDGQVHEVGVRPVGSAVLLNGSPRSVQFGLGELFMLVPDDQVLHKHALAGRVLDQIEVLAEHDLKPAQHVALLAMESWLRAQPFAGSLERTARQLHRLTSARCRLDLDGLVAPARIEGQLTDLWKVDDELELELREGERVLARGSSSKSGGRFAFVLPADVIDGRGHVLSLHLPGYGAALGPWTFLLLRPGQDDDPLSAWVGDQVWGLLPRQPEGAAPVGRAPTRQALTAAVAGQWVHAQGDDAAERRLQALMEHADALLEAGEWTTAAATYREARVLDAEHVPAFAGEIRALAGQGNDEAARQLAEAAVELFPDEGGLAALVDRLDGRRRTHDCRLVAFYLPQFHPIAENDAWWGEGFTEWANVTAATPLFEGHLQPRRPGALGFYDLRLPASANAQFDLARRYGIDGFCYYYYWFEGRRVLERPLQDLVEGRTGPFPFCICWANEDWTRSWDGATGDVLLAQNHSEESDFAFIRDLAPLLRHADYIRVNGRPMVLVYRADKLAEPEATVERWRQWCRDNGIGELHLCAVQSFGFDDPRPLGFDAAVEFPPHCLRERHAHATYIQELHDLPGMVAGFGGAVLDYQAFASAAIARPREPYALHRTAMVAWDNTARRQKTAHVYHGFTIDCFERWVEQNLRRAALEQPDALCFVNAWNEWAEGSVMEPDVHFGHEVLEATRRARQQARISPHATYWTGGKPQFFEARLTRREHVLLVGHDAHLHGAQTNLLNMARCLKRELQMDISILLIEGGALLPDYERVGPTEVLGRDEGWLARLGPRLAGLAARGIRKAICNTVVTGEVCDQLKQHGFRVVGLVHELPTLIESGQLQAHCWRLAAQADALVFASRLVAREFCQRYWPPEERVLIAPQGIALNGHVKTREAARSKVRTKLGVPGHSLLIMGCGYGDTRKGFDLFVQMAGQVARECSELDLAFLWVGKVAEALGTYAQADLARMKLKSRFFITGQTREAPLYFAASDVFALSSREDPFPSVVMEAFDAHMPVVAFEGAGGFVDIVNQETGALVPYLDVDAMSAAIVALLRDGPRRHAIGRHNHQLCREQFTYAPYMRKLLALLADVKPVNVAAGLLERQPWAGRGKRPLVSVIVPNYNYAEYLELRLQTILTQTLAPDEIIVLDDASTDTSLALLRAMAARSTIPMRIVESAANSGSPFPQWARGLEMASGDLVWIAEADDYCEPNLLETLAAEFDDDAGVVLAWADSVMVDEQGQSHGAQYKTYYTQRYGAKWSQPFRMPGRELIEDCLLTENVLPNASAIVFRRSALRADDLRHLTEHRFSGDWWLWIALASRGKVVYRPEPLNYHRRHTRSVMGQVLRAGSSLLHETIAFYQQLLDRSADLFTPNSLRQVYARLEQLYCMFPEHVLLERRLGSHPDYARAYADLRKSAQRVVAPRPNAQASGVFVVSGQTLAEPAHAWQVLDTVKQQFAWCTHWRVLVLEPAQETITEPDAPVFDPQEWRVREPDLVLLQPSMEELHSEFGTGPAAAVVVSHGLAAHSMVARLQDCRPSVWWLVASSEFNALLGEVPQDEAEGVEAQAHAVATCSRVCFTTDVPSHALARIARFQKRPLAHLSLEPSEGFEGKTAAPALRIAALASQAPLAAWRATAHHLHSVNEQAQDLGFMLVYAEGMTDEARRLHEASPDLQAQFVHLMPKPGRPMAQFYLRSESQAPVVETAAAQTLSLETFLKDPAASLASLSNARLVQAMPAAELPAGAPAKPGSKASALVARVARAARAARARLG